MLYFDRTGRGEPTIVIAVIVAGALGGFVSDRLAGAHPPRAERGPVLWRREPGQERHELLPD